MAKMSSVGSFFEKRGDPMVSPREGREKYGRIVDIEDADYDANKQRLTSKYWDRKLAEELRRNPTVVAKTKHVPDSPEVIAQRRARNVLRQSNIKHGRF